MKPRWLLLGATLGHVRVEHVADQVGAREHAPGVELPLLVDLLVQQV